MSDRTHTSTLALDGFPLYAQIPNWVLLSKALSHGAKCLYGIIMIYADKHTLAAFPGRERLADDLGVKSRQVSTYIKELEGVGAVTVERRRNQQTGNFYVNNYTLHFAQRSPEDTQEGRTDAAPSPGAVFCTPPGAVDCTITRTTTRTRTTEVPRSTTSIQVSRAATPRRTAAEPKPTTQQRIARAAANDPVSPTWYHSTDRQDLISRVQAIADAKTSGSDTWDAEEAFWDALDAALDADISGMQDQGWAPPRKATSKHGAAAWLNMLLAAWQAESGPLNHEGQDRAA